jgi:hypothetical protein
MILSLLKLGKALKNKWMNKFLAFFFVSFLFFSCSAKVENPEENVIKKTIVDFLKWYRWHKDTGVSYAIIKDQQLDNKMKKQILDMEGVEKYLLFLKSSNFLSEIFLNQIRGNFLKINSDLSLMPPIDSDAIVKIDGLDLDIVLQSFEPELIIDHLDRLYIKKIVILGNKSIAQVKIKNQTIDMVFILSNKNNKWVIDEIGYE